MASSSVLHTLANRAPRSRSRKERQKEVALSRYAPLVKYVVDRLALHLPKSVERDDLISAAIIGLFDALEKYDSSKGTKFETYAIWRIRGAILDELRSLDWASRSIRRKARDGAPLALQVGIGGRGPGLHPARGHRRRPDAQGRARDHGDRGIARGAARD